MIRFFLEKRFLHFISREDFFCEKVYVLELEHRMYPRRRIKLNIIQLFYPVMVSSFCLVMARWRVFLLFSGYVDTSGFRSV